MTPVRKDYLIYVVGEIGYTFGRKKLGLFSCSHTKIPDRSKISTQINKTIERKCQWLCLRSWDKEGFFNHGTKVKNYFLKKPW